MAYKTLRQERTIMDVYFKQGATHVILPPPEPFRQSNNKSGVSGVCHSVGKYFADVGFNGERYHLGKYDNLYDAKQIRLEAEEKIAEGTFLMWHKLKFPPKENKYGVNGLWLRSDTSLFSLDVFYQGEKYCMGSFKTIEGARAIRNEADIHILDGTFEDWVNEYKKGR